MNELIKVEQKTIGTEEVNAVDARELWNFLGSKQQFGNWIENKVTTNLFFEENIDWIVLNKSINAKTVQPQGLKRRIDYALTVDTAKKVAMSEQTQKGNEIRKYFINCEKRLEALVSPKTQIQVLQETIEILTGHEKKLLNLTKENKDTL